MRRIGLFSCAVLLSAAGIGFAQQANNKSKQPVVETAPAPIPAEAAAKQNPVKVTPEGLAEAKKLYGYHCSMCHGKDGDGKGDLAEQMKLNLKDWRGESIAVLESLKLRDYRIERCSFGSVMSFAQIE